MSAQPRHLKRHTRNALFSSPVMPGMGLASQKGMNVCRLNSGVPRPAGQALVPFQACKGEAALLGRLDHIMHLAQHILKENMLLTQAFHPMQLL